MKKTFAFHSSIHFMSTHIPIPSLYVTEACYDHMRLRKVDHYHIITLEVSDIFTSYQDILVYTTYKLFPTIYITRKVSCHNVTSL